MGKRRNEELPIIMGITPPNKAILVVKTDKPLRGYSCYIMYAEFPEGTRPNDTWDFENTKLKSLGAWLHFKDVETMRSFGQMFVDFADKTKESGTERIKALTNDELGMYYASSICGERIQIRNGADLMGLPECFQKEHIDPLFQKLMYPGTECICAIAKKWDDLEWGKDMKNLRKVLTYFAGYDMVPPVDEPNCANLLEFGQFWLGYKLAFKPGMYSGSHANAAHFYSAEPDKYALCTGYAMAEDGLWRQHSWLMDADDGHIVETTSPSNVYYGYVLTEEQAKEFVRTHPKKEEKNVQRRF